MWQTWWSISSDRWLMSKITSTQLCKRLWASAGLVSCFHVPSAYSGHCSTKATRPLPPPPFTLKPLPTSGASVGPREEITTTEWFIWAALRHQSATVFLVEMQRRVWKVTKLGHMIWGRGGHRKFMLIMCLHSEGAVVGRVSHSRELIALVNN